MRLKTRKVILFLVEGSSELTALIQPFEEYFKRNARVEGEAFFCDVTTVELYGSTSGIQVSSNIKNTVRKYVVELVDRKRLYTWTDLARIIHVVDLDGAFVQDDRVVEQSGIQHIVYKHDSIVCADRERILKRNHVKAKNTISLVRTSALMYGRRSVPYQVYYMSRNLEHALFGIERDLTDEQKERLSRGFADECRKDPDKLVQTLTDSAVLHAMDYRESWEWAQDGTSSLHRGSNLGLVVPG